MKIGDLVKVKECPDFGKNSRLSVLAESCSCFFCATKSNRIGVVTAVAPRNSFHVMFDTGMWRLDMFDVSRGDVKVIRSASSQGRENV
tara:strand:- start:187 stop:450 length:264 start_codon:yes stop_codon:yes gene_type:complete